MSDVISFEIPGQPVGKGRPRAARMGRNIRLYTPEKTASYESLVRMAGYQAMAGRQPLEGPVNVTMVLECQIPKSWSRKRQEAAIALRELPTTKPDVDNCVKAIFDAINGVVWVDDCQVTGLSLRKIYSTTPRAVVLVQRCEVAA